jgi:hypothetical protein
MVQQSNTEPRGTEKTTQGKQTREHQKAVISGQERSDGIDVDPHAKSLAEAREDSEQPAGEFEISHGDRSIQRGANDRGPHDKHH